jgi:hypothetical protein
LTKLLLLVALLKLLSHAVSYSPANIHHYNGPHLMITFEYDPVPALAIDQPEPSTAETSLSVQEVIDRNGNTVETA